MKTTSLFQRRLLAAGLAALLALNLPPVLAAGQTGGEAVSLSAGNHPPALILAHGDITMPDGSHEPATLSNVADVIRQYFPSANLILIGTADVALDNVTLHWNADAHNISQLASVLHALAASSDNQFAVTMQDKGFTFVLARPETANGEAQRHVGVFNVAPQRDPAFASLEADLRAAQGNVSELTLRYSERHPLVLTAQAHAVLLKKQLQQLTDRQTASIDARLKEIQTSVLETLHDLGKNDKPTFRFHPNTSLLIVVGSDEAISITGKIVTAMGGSGVGNPGQAEATPGPAAGPADQEPAAPSPSPEETAPPQPAPSTDTAPAPSSP